MKSEIGRRMFVGSVVAGAPLLGVTMIPNGFAQSKSGSAGEPGGRDRIPQPADRNAFLVRELHQELRNGITTLLSQRTGEGGRQIASTIRIYASIQSDDDVRAMLAQVVKKVGRSQLLSTPRRHAEMERLARELGVPRELLPAHAHPDPFLQEQALNVLLTKGLSPMMRGTAMQLQEFATELDRRRDGKDVRSVAVVQCVGGACDTVCTAAVNAQYIAEVACVAAGLFPPLAEICLAAGANWLALAVACAVCLMGLYFC